MLKDLFSGRDISIPQMMVRLKQIARDLQLPFGDREMTYNSRLAQELGKWAEQEGKGDLFHAAVFHAYFADGRNIGDIGQLSDIAISLGLNADEVHDVIAARTYRQAVDADWARAAEFRITAVPTFLMKGQLVVGAQEYHVLADFMRSNNVNKLSSDR